ncbi:hypothetical protein HUS23_09085 [Ectothiorhodospiraceae bacterium 2226]|nr:hypothetical protein HUS23_09085 [Ectothiorhodospiraceae bacterium 2226]
MGIASGDRATHDPHVEAAVENVDRAVRQGAYGAARMRFLQLAEDSRVQVLERVRVQDAARLAGSLPAYSVARLYERLPGRLGQAIVRALPRGKRHGVGVILHHRRRVWAPEHAAST